MEYTDEKLKRNRDRLVNLIEEAQRNSETQDPAEILALVLEAQKAIRADNQSLQR